MDDIGNADGTGIERFDIVVFGGGKGGKTLAMDQARTGKRVAVVEAGMIGGSCINVACIPTKTLVRSAQTAALARRAGEDGLLRGSRPAVGMERVAARTAAVVAGMVELNRRAFAASGLELVLGWGRFVSPRVIEVDTAAGPRRLTAGRIVLDLGTRATIPPVPGLREAAPLTHVEALRLDALPRRLLVVGGGYIGMELGQAFRLLGSEVAILDHGPRLAPREDADVSGAIADTFRGGGIELAFDAAIAAASGRSGEAVALELRDGREYRGSHLLVAAGRTPMTADIGLELAGVEVDARGFVRVDERLCTAAPGIWALGEAAGSPMFTHVSLDDFRVAKDDLAGNGRRTTAGRLVPYAVFIEPEFARVGLNETEARAGGIPYRLARLPMAAVPRARTLGETGGFMKALVAPDDRILGFSMLGAQAGEVMTTVQVAMLAGLPFTVLRDAILAHPTVAEGLGLLFDTVQPVAVPAAA